MDRTELRRRMYCACQHAIEDALRKLREAWFAVLSVIGLSIWFRKYVLNP